MYSLARIKGIEKEKPRKKFLFSGLSGAPYWIRTSGLTLRRRALYPAELMALIWDCGAQGECTSSHLGGDRSILLSYRCILGAVRLDNSLTMQISEHRNLNGHACKTL
jgi:hypothetical protein